MYVYTLFFTQTAFADRQMKSSEEGLQLAEQGGRRELVAEEGVYVRYE